MELTVGGRLKSAREDKSVTLEEACRVTKIQRRVLESIEGDKVLEILDPAYAKIFIKKYAAYLGADGPAVAEEYLAAHGTVVQAAPVSTVAGSAARPPAQPAADWRPLAAGIGAGLAALVGIGFLVYLGVDLAHNLKQDRPARVAAARQKAEEKKVASKPLLVPISKKLQLTVHASSNVWLQVKADGSVIFQNVLAKGAKESWDAQRELELWTGNAGAMNLTLNGKPLEGVGRGVKKGIRITHAGIEQ